MRPPELCQPCVFPCSSRASTTPSTPRLGRAVVRVLEPTRPDRRLPDGPDVLWPDALQHRLPARGAPAGPPLRRRVRDAEVVVSPSASCVAMVRDLYPRAAELAGDPTLADAVAALTPRVFELSEFLVEKLGVEDVGAYYPAPGDVSTRPATPSGCSASATRRCGCSGGPGDRPRRAARGRGVLRLRRDVRRQERGHVDGDARRQARCILDTRARSALRPTTRA